MELMNSPEALRNRLSGSQEEKKFDPIWWGVIIVLVLFVFLKAFVFTSVYVSGDSMDPNLCDGQYLIGNRLTASIGNYSYGDIVVVTVEVDEDGEPVSGGKKIIKRIVGLEGDVIDFKNGRFYRNGNVVDESYLPDGVETLCSGSGFPYTVEEGDIFVLGDNRAISKDSRSDIEAYRKISKKQVFAVIPDWSLRYEGLVSCLV